MERCPQCGEELEEVMEGLFECGECEQTFEEDEIADEHDPEEYY